VFAVKGSRYITHMLRLTFEKPLANFFASGIFNLRDKLGPSCGSFRRSSAFKPERMEAFFSALPRDLKRAAALARRRDARMTGRSRLAIDANRPLRHAVEVRHESFENPLFIAQLRRHGVALVVADTAGKWPYCEDVTSDFMYLRLHGDSEIYVSGYTDAALSRWAARILAWAKGGEPPDARRVSAEAPAACRSRDVYCYFDNDVKVRAPIDAHALMRKLGLPVSVESAVERAARGTFTPESLDRLPYAARVDDARWRFPPSGGRRAGAALAGTGTRRST
jgi:uncharacterized protein YecE (DUF72 family)